MYAKVPAVDGVPQVGTINLIQSVSLSPTEALVQFEGPVEEGWIEVSQAEFEAVLPPVAPGPPPETTEQKLARLEEQNLILMDALATTFEEVLALRGIVEGGTGA